MRIRSSEQAIKYKYRIIDVTVTASNSSQSLNLTSLISTLNAGWRGAKKYLKRLRPNASLTIVVLNSSTIGPFDLELSRSIRSCHSPLTLPSVKVCNADQRTGSTLLKSDSDTEREWNKIANNTSARGKYRRIWAEDLKNSYNRPQRK